MVFLTVGIVGDSLAQTHLFMNDLYKVMHPQEQKIIKKVSVNNNVEGYCSWVHHFNNSTKGRNSKVTIFDFILEQFDDGKKFEKQFNKKHKVDLILDISDKHDLDFLDYEKDDRILKIDSLEQCFMFLTAMIEEERVIVL